MNKTVSLKDTIVLLNELLALDRQAVHKLFDESRVVCNEAISNHPTVQVDSQEEGDSLGILGILNGLFGVNKDGRGLITAVYDDDDVLIKFIETGE